MKKDVFESNENHLVIDCSNYPNDLYYLSVFTSDSILHRKIIIQK